MFMFPPPPPRATTGLRNPRFINCAEVANRLFFAEDSGGDDKLTMRKFSTYVQTLQQEALVMQFHQWDRRGEGTLTATDFAKYLATKVRRRQSCCTRRDRVSVRDSQFGDQTLIDKQSLR